MEADERGLRSVVDKGGLKRKNRYVINLYLLLAVGGNGPNVVKCQSNSNVAANSNFYYWA